MRWYSNLLQTHPWTTKCLTTAIINQVGDFICQKYSKNKVVDWKRNFNMFSIGLIYFGPVLTLWYSKLLPKIAKNFYPNFAKFGRVFTNLVLDRLFFSPILMAVYYPLYGVFEQLSISGLKKGWNDTKLKWWDTMMLNLKVWPLGIFINFWFIDPKYHVLFNNFIALFWSIILSHLTYN